jgi:hypothetical protein
LRGPVHQNLHLLGLRDIGLNGRVIPERKLIRERLKPFKAARPENQLGALPSEMPRRRRAEAAARTGDDNHLAIPGVISHLPLAAGGDDLLSGGDANIAEAS